MQTCPFCDQQVKLLHQKSHIIPKWMEGEIYNSKGKTIYTEITKGAKGDILQYSKPQKKQSGLIAKDILCSNCEKDFGEFDKKAADIFKNQHSIAETRSIGVLVYPSFGHPIQVTTIKNFSFADLQRFIFSVIVRGHLWCGQRGMDLLGKKHFARFKEYLKGDIDSDCEYPIHLMKTKGFGFNFTPIRMRASGSHWMQIFHGYGLLFTVYTSSHRKKPQVMECRVQKGHPAYIPEYESGTLLDKIERTMSEARNAGRHLFQKV